MLQHLRISNFALIEKLDLDWQTGFTTITGETGAGKSILLGALNHLLGQRADLKALKDPEQKCVIEGLFQIPDPSYKSLFESLDLDYEAETIIRREILTSGKSRAFVNDSPVRLESLSQLAQRLIDIHSQHDTLLLNDANFQLDLIDSFGSHQSLLQEYQQAFKNWRKSQKRMAELEAQNRAEGGDLDYLEFLHQELVDAKLIPGEVADIEARLEILEHSGKIESALASVQEMADANPLGLSEMLRQMRQELRAIANLDKKLGSFSERAESLYIEFEDLRQELELYQSEGNFDPREKEQLDERLSQLIHLQRKHQAESAEELIEKRDALEAKMSAAADRDIALEKEKAEASQWQAKTESLAQELHEERQKLKAPLEAQVLDLLADLNLANARFDISIEPQETCDTNGHDRVNFLFSANPGQKLQSLQKVASGGELSRVMLALKAILARSRSLPTIIFDEIDTGVSGETAHKIGEILKGMGSYMQVIAISHLAQIASKGSQHYLVRKESEADNTRTEIRPLNEEERLNEIARLLGGDKLTEAALANARELIQRA